MSKETEILNIYNEWLMLFQERKSIISVLQHYKYRRIVVYGMGSLGERLCDEIINTDIGMSVVYALDMKKEGNYRTIPILHPEGILDLNIDAIIVTAVTYFDEIESLLKTKFGCPIISLEDIIYEAN